MFRPVATDIEAFHLRVHARCRYVWNMLTTGIIVRYCSVIVRV